jgi:hypothetical protein
VCAGERALLVPVLSVLCGKRLVAEA